MNKCPKRNQLLLACARRPETLQNTNRRLAAYDVSQVNEEEWQLWTRFYAPLADDPLYEHEIVQNGRTLNWLARDLNEKRKKEILS